MASLNQLVGSDTNEQTYKKFGQQQIANMFAQFGAPFSKATKVPAGMAREVTKIKKKHDAMILRLKAQAAAGVPKEGYAQKLNEAENPDDNDFVKTYKPILLDGRNLRGSDDPISEYDKGLPSTHMVRTFG
jgi:hypothetical protein